MANYTVYAQYSGGKGNSMEWKYPNNAAGNNTGTGHSSSTPLDVSEGDQITFSASGAIGPGAVTVSGLNIFTNNSNFNIAFSGSGLGYPVSVARTVAAGALTVDTITGANSQSTSDSFHFERQPDHTPSGFTHSGGWVGAGLQNQYYYAGLAQNVAATTSAGTAGSYTVAGVDPGCPVTVSLDSGTATNAHFSKNSTSTWYSPSTTNITCQNNDVIRFRVLSSSVGSTAVVYRLHIGTVSRHFSVQTAVDTTPNNFTNFTSASNSALSSFVYSNIQYINGLTGTGAPVSVSGTSSQNLVSVAGGGYTSFPPNITNNQSIRVRHISASTNSTSVTTNVNIGGVTRSFTSTTVGLTSPVVNNSQTGASGNTSTYAASFAHTISLSQAGQGGTLEYNITIGSSSGGAASTTTPTSGWTTNPVFTVYRGRRHHFWARRSTTVFDRTNNSIYVPYIYGGGAFTISPTNRDVTSSTTSTTFTINYTTGTTLSSNHQIFLYPTGSSTSLGSRTGSGNITVSNSNSGWPSLGNTTNFTAWTRLPVNKGGNNTLYQNTSAAGSITFADTNPNNPTLKTSAGTNSTSETGATTSTYYYRKFTTVGVSSGNNIIWTASGNGRLSTSQYGTYNTTVTRQLNQTAWLRIESSSAGGTTVSTAVSHSSGASATFSVTTTGSGGGSTGSGGGGTSDYGLQVFNSSNNEILGPSHRSLGIVYTGSTGQVNTGSSVTLSAPGMTSGNSGELVIILTNSSPGATSITRGTNQFTFANNSGSTINTTYYLVRA